jgi:hypothetical protein
MIVTKMSRFFRILNFIHVTLAQRHMIRIFIIIFSSIELA